MKNIILFLFVLICSDMYSQNQKDTIQIIERPRLTFKMNDVTLNNRNLVKLMKSNPEAYRSMVKAKNNDDMANAMISTSMIAFGVFIGSSFAGGENTWIWMGFGAGLALLSFPFSIAHKNHAINAAKIYNNGLKSTGQRRYDLQFGMTQNGIGLQLRF
jgi:hypothetical protein